MSASLWSSASRSIYCVNVQKTSGGVTFDSCDHLRFSLHSECNDEFDSPMNEMRIRFPGIGGDAREMDGITKEQRCTQGNSSRQLRADPLATQGNILEAQLYPRHVIEAHRKPDVIRAIQIALYL